MLAYLVRRSVHLVHLDESGEFGRWARVRVPTTASMSSHLGEPGVVVALAVVVAVAETVRTRSVGSCPSS